MEKHAAKGTCRRLNCGMPGDVGLRLRYDVLEESTHCPMNKTFVACHVYVTDHPV